MVPCVLSSTSASSITRMASSENFFGFVRGRALVAPFSAVASGSASAANGEGREVSLGSSGCQGTSMVQSLAGSTRSCSTMLVLVGRDSTEPLPVCCS